jgi:hypothetical protein
MDRAISSCPTHAENHANAGTHSTIHTTNRFREKGHSEGRRASAVYVVLREVYNFKKKNTKHTLSQNVLTQTAYLRL